MEHKIIGIRADGNAQIGMGHLMRCMSIAAALKDKNYIVKFFTNSEHSQNFIIDKGFFCQLINNKESMDQEIPEMISLLQEQHVQMLIIDSYRITDLYTVSLSKYVKVFYLDDIATNLVPADGVINYNIYAESLPYKSHYGNDCVCILGSKYAPVKKEFFGLQYQVREKVSDILVTMGGSDTLNIAGRLGEVLLKQLPSDICITIVCGKFSPHYQKVKALEVSDPRVQVLTDVKDMWNVMCRSDLAISAAGSTMYELCTIGVPSICCYYVDNQKLIAESFAEKTSMMNAGDFSKVPDYVLDNIIEEVKNLIDDYPKRKMLSEEMHKISDGCGTLRIADILTSVLATI